MSSFRLATLITIYYYSYEYLYCLSYNNFVFFIVKTVMLKQWWWSLGSGASCIFEG
jgi:hypothetical protein